MDREWLVRVEGEYCIGREKGCVVLRVLQTTRDALR